MTAYQKQSLRKSFQAKPYMEKDEKHQLAKSFNISEKKIVKWYEKRRYQIRQKRLPIEFGEECSSRYSISDNVLKRRG